MRPRRDRSGTALLFALAATTVVVHCLVGGRYGFHRDELATLDDARHLAWGYVAYPPVTPFFGWLSLHFFGTSLPGFRFFASLAGAAAIVLTGLMARELGGTRGAQLLAAAATTPIVLGIGSLMQYVSFDYLAWVGVAYFMIKLCRTGNARWWLAVGTAIGFGMLSKYSMPFLVAGIALGVLVGDLRTHLRSKYLWLGAALALLIFLPNFIWQWHHDFISLDFLRHIHARDIRIGRTRTFLPDQLEITLVALPLALAGLYFYFFPNAGRRFRVLGWMFVIPLVLFLIGKGRGYYLAPAYPMLYAAGVAWWQAWLQRLSPAWRASLVVTFLRRPSGKYRPHGRIFSSPGADKFSLVECRGENQRGPAGRDWLARARGNSRSNSKFIATGRTRPGKNPRRELRRSRRHQSLRPGAGLAARHLLDEFVLGAWLR